MSETQKTLAVGYVCLVGVTLLGFVMIDRTINRNLENATAQINGLPDALRRSLLGR